MTDIFQSHSHLPYGAVGSGHYGASLAHLDMPLIDLVYPDILKALDTVPVKTGELVGIGDYGTADGAVSMKLIGQVIQFFRKKYGADVPVQVVYEDQSSNDFNSLFRRLHGMINDPPTFLKEHDNVFTMATGSNFYQQCVPSNTLHLCVSFIAAHWMSARPTKFRDSFHRFPNATPEESALVTKQSAKDWEQFLLMRAKELTSGGVLVISIPGEDPERRHHGYQACNQGFEEGLLDVWRDFRDQGIISQKEFLDTNMNRCQRRQAEVEAPFKDSNSAVCKAGLRLLSARIEFGECQSKIKWRETLKQTARDDRATFAHEVVEAHRCWSNSALMSGLSESRPLAERERIVDQAYATLKERVAKTSPEDFKSGFLLLYVFAQKA